MGTNSKANRDGEAAFRRSAERLGYVLVGFDGVYERAQDDDIWLRSFTVRGPDDVNQEWFVVCRAFTGGQAVVAFHAAATFAEAVRGFCERFQNRSLKWRDDQYAGH